MAPPNTSGTEVEFKLRVDDLAQLMRIAIASGGTPEPTLVQTNQFFDTADRALDAARCVVRLRQESTSSHTHFFVTVKGPSLKAGAKTTVAEEEVEIDEVTARAIRAGADPLAPLHGSASATRLSLLAHVVTAAGNQPLVLVGQFENERTRIAARLPHESGRVFDVELELDRTRFPGDQVHHEVELEVRGDVDADAVGHAFHALFARAGVAGRAAPGKARRFFQALAGQRLDP